MGTPWLEAISRKKENSLTARRDKLMAGLLPGRVAKANATSGAYSAHPTQTPNASTTTQVGGPQLIGAQRSPLLRPGKKRKNVLLGGG